MSELRLLSIRISPGSNDVRIGLFSSARLLLFQGMPRTTFAAPFQRLPLPGYLLESLVLPTNLCELITSYQPLAWNVLPDFECRFATIPVDFPDRPKRRNVMGAVFEASILLELAMISPHRFL